MPSPHSIHDECVSAYIYQYYLLLYMRVCVRSTYTLNISMHIHTMHVEYHQFYSFVTGTGHPSVHSDRCKRGFPDRQTDRRTDRRNRGARGSNTHTQKHIYTAHTLVPQVPYYREVNSSLSLVCVSQSSRRLLRTLRLANRQAQAHFSTPFQVARGGVEVLV